VYFLGTFDYAMDERGRVPIPPRYRDVFREGMVLSQGAPDACIKIFTMDGFEKYARRYTARSPLHRAGRDLRLALFSRSEHAQLDPQNRVLIPGSLRAYANLSGKVKLAGGGECLQLWNPDAYAEAVAAVDPELERTLESTDPWQE
jgi:MraZ protein